MMLDPLFREDADRGVLWKATTRAPCTSAWRGVVAGLRLPPESLAPSQTAIQLALASGKRHPHEDLAQPKGIASCAEHRRATAPAEL